MNVAMMHEVIRISDRFMDYRDPDSIDRQGRLSSVFVMVLIFHVVMGIAMWKIHQLDLGHPRIIPDVDVQFELQPPPPVATFKVGQTAHKSVTPGAIGNPGAAAAPAPQSARVTLPTIEAPQTSAVPIPEQARPVVSRRTTLAPPVAVTPTNTIKAAPANISSTATLRPPPVPVIGAPSANPASGADQAGGGPEGVAGATGTGGVGTGGTGKGEGDPGAGTGLGTGGNDIAHLPVQRAMGNIAPYRKDLLTRIAQNWQPKRKYDSIVVLAEIAKDGQLLHSEIFQSSGNKKADKEALTAIEATAFAPLPEWFKGESLPFKIELARVEALKQ